MCLFMGPTDLVSFETPYPESIHDARRRVMPALRKRQANAFFRAGFFAQMDFSIGWWPALLSRHIWAAVVRTVATSIWVLAVASAATAQNPAELLVKEPALATDPAVSADGRLLVYASDRGGSRSLNLWLRPLAGGDSRKLTEEASDQHEPAFSPDGLTLAYRSEAGEGGIYLLPFKGGKPRLLIRGGRRPRFSFDGERIVYWAADRLFVIDAAGGEPRAIHPEFRSARDGIWSPDGKYLIFAGCRDDSAASCDCWVTPVEGGEPVATGAAHRLSGQPSPDLWLAGNAIVFTVKNADKGGLWVLNLAASSWHATGTPQRLTSAEYDARSPAAGPGGTILFATRTMNIDLWSLPLDADRALVRGALIRLTDDPAIDQRPSLSVDGRKVAWETSRGGNFEVWVKDLVSKKEHGVTSGPLREHMPTLSRDGSKVAYDAHDAEKVTVFESAFDGGEPVPVSVENVGQGVFQWTPKGDALLYFHREPPGTVGLLNLSSKERDSAPATSETQPLPGRCPSVARWPLDRIPCAVRSASFAPCDSAAFRKGY